MAVYSGEQLKYLKLLSQKYPTIAAASTEIINLEAILNLPKGTEHVVSDLHGEADRFSHIFPRSHRRNHSQFHSSAS